MAKSKSTKSSNLGVRDTRVRTDNRRGTNANRYRQVSMQSSVPDLRQWTPYLAPQVPAPVMRQPIVPRWLLEPVSVQNSTPLNPPKPLYNAPVAQTELTEASICARRHIRREVILATGNGGPNRYRRPKSGVKC